MSTKTQSNNQQANAFEILFKFKDRGEITIKDKKIIEKLNRIVRVIEEKYPLWRDSDAEFNATINVPFPKSAGKFVFENVKNYVAPQNRSSVSNIQKHYPQTQKLDLEDLKNVIELGNFFETTDFAKSMGFVIADRLKHHDIDQIINFLGIEQDTEPASEPSTSTGSTKK